MSSISDYKARVNSSMRASLINDSKTRISQSFKNSPSYQEVYINSSSSLTGVRIVDDSESKEQKVVLTLNDTPYTFGDYLTWNGEKWLTSIVDNMGGIYKRGVITRCISSLKWLNADGFVREAYFAYKSQAIHGMGIQNGTYMALDNERRIVAVQYNQDSKLIRKTQKFIFDERAWKVTSLDRLETGVINLELEATEINTATDNVELRIADYVGNVANYSVVILEGDTIGVNTGATAQLTVQVTNNGNVVTKDVIFSSSNEAIASISSTGVLSGNADGSCTITAKLVIDTTVQDSISVSVATVIADNWTLSVAEDPDVLNSTTVTFNAVVKNNGLVVTGREIQWSLWDDTQTTTTTKAVITSSTATQCSIRGDALGYVKLKMVLVDPNINVSTFIRIRISSVF